MKSYLVLSSTNNLIGYNNQIVKVVPKAVRPVILFKMNMKKGCGRIVKV